MKRSYALISLSSLMLATVFVGCSDDSTPAAFVPPTGGGSAGSPAAGGATPSNGGTPTSLGGSGGSVAQSSGAGGMPAGGSAGSGGVAAGGGGTGGVAAGGGGTGGAAAGSGGTGGAPAVVVPADLLIDSIILRLKSDDGAGGMGGAGGQPNAVDPGLGGAGLGGIGGAGSVDVARSFLFGATVEGWALHPEGSTPGIGTAGGAEKLSAKSTLTWLADQFNPGNGAIELKIPFSIKDEQLDIVTPVAPTEDWSGYELVARVQEITKGSIGECLGAWTYATSAGYLFSRGEIVPLMQGQWVNLVFDLDAPSLDPDRSAAFDKTQINQFGVMVQSRACP
jgi:hypothetical protein